MGDVYLGIAILILVAAIIIGAVIYAIGPLLTLATLGITAVLTGLIWLALNLLS